MGEWSIMYDKGQEERLGLLRKKGTKEAMVGKRYKHFMKGCRVPIENTLKAT